MLSQKPLNEKDTLWNYPQRPVDHPRIRPCHVSLFRIPQHVANRLDVLKSLRLDNFSWPLNLDNRGIGEIEYLDGVEPDHGSMSYARMKRGNNMVQRPNGSLDSDDTDDKCGLRFPSLLSSKHGSDAENAQLVLTENGQHPSACRVNQKCVTNLYSEFENRDFTLAQGEPRKSSALVLQPCDQVFPVEHAISRNQCQNMEQAKSSNIFDVLSEKPEKIGEGMLKDDVSLVCSWALKTSCYLNDCDGSFDPAQVSQGHSGLVDVPCSADKEREYEVAETCDQDIDCASSESLRFYDMLLSSDEASSNSVPESEETRLLSVSDNKDILSDVLGKVFFGDENSDSSKNVVSPGGLQWHTEGQTKVHYQQFEPLENSTDTQLNFSNVLNSLDYFSTRNCAENTNETVATLVEELVNSVSYHVSCSSTILNSAFDLDENSRGRDTSDAFHSENDTRSCSVSNVYDIHTCVKQVVENLLSSVSGISEHNCHNVHNQSPIPITNSLIEVINKSSCDIQGQDNTIDSVKKSKCTSPNSKLPHQELTKLKLCTFGQPNDTNQTGETINSQRSSEIINSTSRGTCEIAESKKQQAVKRKLDSITYCLKECNPSSHSQCSSELDAQKDAKVPKLLIVKNGRNPSNNGKRFASKIIKDRCKKNSLRISFKKISWKTRKHQFTKQTTLRANSNNELTKTQNAIDISQSSDLDKIAGEIPYDPYNFELEDELCKKGRNLDVPKLLHLPLSRSPSPSLICHANVDSNHVIKSVNLEESEVDDTRENSPVDTAKPGVENLMQLLVTNVQDATMCWKNRKSGSLQPITEEMLEDMADELGKQFDFDQEDIQSFKQSAKNILAMVETVHQRKRRKWSKGCIEKKKPKLPCKEKEVQEKDIEQEVADPSQQEEISVQQEQIPVTTTKMEDTSPEDEELSELSVGHDSYREKESVTPSPSLSSMDNEPEGSQDSTYFGSHCKRMTTLRRRKRSTIADLEGMLTRMRSLRNRGGDDVLTVDFDDPIPLEYKERRKNRHKRKNLQQLYNEDVMQDPGNVPEEEQMEMANAESPQSLSEASESLVIDETRVDDDYETETKKPRTTILPCESRSVVDGQKQETKKHNWLSLGLCSNRSRAHSTEEESPHTSNNIETTNEGDIERSEDNARDTQEEVSSPTRGCGSQDVEIPSKTKSERPTDLLTSLNQDAVEQTQVQTEPNSPETTAKESPLDLSQWTGIQQATSTVTKQESDPNSVIIEDIDSVPDVEDYTSEDSPLPSAPVGLISSTIKTETESPTEVNFKDESCELPKLSPQIPQNECCPKEEWFTETPHLEKEMDHGSSKTPSPRLTITETEIINIDIDTDTDTDMPKITNVCSLADTTDSMNDEVQVIERPTIGDSRGSAFHPVQKERTATHSASTHMDDKPSRDSSIADGSAQRSPKVMNDQSTSTTTPFGTQVLQQPTPLKIPLSMTKEMFNAQYERLRNELMTLELIARQKERERNNIIRLKLYKQSVMRKLQLKKVLMQQQMQFHAQRLATTPPGTSATSSNMQKQPTRYPPIAPRLFTTPLSQNYFLAASAMQAQAKQVPTVSSTQPATPHGNESAEKASETQVNRSVEGPSKTSFARPSYQPHGDHSLRQHVHEEKTPVAKPTPLVGGAPLSGEPKLDKTKSRTDTNSSLSSVETIVAKANENFGLQFQGWVEDSQRMMHPYHQRTALATRGQPPVKLDVPSKTVHGNSLQANPSHGHGLSHAAAGLLAEAEKRSSRSLDNAIRNVYSRKFNGMSSVGSHLQGIPVTTLFGTQMVGIPNIRIPAFSTKTFPATSTVGSSDLSKSDTAGMAHKPEDDAVSTSFQNSTLAKLLLSPLPESKSSKEAACKSSQTDPAKDDPTADPSKAASPALRNANNNNSAVASSSNGPWKPHDKTAFNWPICTTCKLRYARFICAGCNNQWYCSEACQIRDWKFHFKSCQRV